MKKIYFDELSYIFALKGLEFQLSKKGKGEIVFRIGSREREKFRLVKGIHALSALTFSESKGLGFFLSRRRSIWKVQVFFDSYLWIDYYLNFLDFYMKEKGLQMRSFLNSEGWLFLLKEIGELRLNRLKYDYYQWTSTLRLLIPFGIFFKDPAIFFSALKIYYKNK